MFGAVAVHDAMFGFDYTRDVLSLICDINQFRFDEARDVNRLGL